MSTWRRFGSLRLARLCVFAAAALLLAPRPAAGVVVLLKNGDQVFGYLESQDGDKILLREDRTGAEPRLIDRAQIETLLVTVSPERLAELQPDDPPAYLSYAEELAEKKRDPEARDTAMRLYLIAAQLEPRTLGRSALLGMAALARTPREEAKFRAMAFLLDPEHDRALLTAPQTVRPAAAAPGADAAAQAQLLEAVRQIRRGEPAAALDALRQPAVRSAAGSLSHILSYDELLQAGRADPLAGTLLTKLVQAELALTYRPAAAAAEEGPAASESSWSRAVAREGLSPAPSLHLETLTEFDPHASAFRDGRWQRPE